MKCSINSILWILLFGVSALSLLTGCPKKSAKVQMLLNAASNVNPDPRGQALSVMVRIYQLKDKGRLEKADYNSILTADKNTLADDLLDGRERMLEPGQTETLEFQADAEARYIGVAAFFRSPSGDSWRKTIPIRAKHEKISITLQEQSIEITSAGK